MNSQTPDPTPPILAVLVLVLGHPDAVDAAPFDDHDSIRNHHYHHLRHHLAQAETVPDQCARLPRHHCCYCRCCGQAYQRVVAARLRVRGTLTAAAVVAGADDELRACTRSAGVDAGASAVVAAQNHSIPAVAVANPAALLQNHTNSASASAAADTPHSSTPAAPAHTPPHQNHNSHTPVPRLSLIHI